MCEVFSQFSALYAKRSRTLRFGIIASKNKAKFYFEANSLVDVLTIPGILVTIRTGHHYPGEIHKHASQRRHHNPRQIAPITGIDCETISGTVKAPDVGIPHWPYMRSEPL